jgi:WD40 repeat protein
MAQAQEDRNFHELCLGWNVTHLALGMSKDHPVVFFAGSYGGRSHDGLRRWDLRKPYRGDIEKAGQDLTEFRVVDGVGVLGVILSRDGRFLLASYGAPPLLIFTGPHPPNHSIPPFFEVWDVEENKVIRTLKSDEKATLTAAATLSADGKTAVIVEKFRVKPIDEKGPAYGCETRVGFWDVATGKKIHMLPEKLGGPVALSPDGKLLAASQWKGAEGKMVLVDATTGKVQVTLEAPKHPKEDLMSEWTPYELRFAPSGKYVAGRDTRRAKPTRGWVVWDMQGKIVLGAEYKSQPRSLCFLPEADKKGREWLTYEDGAEVDFRNPFRPVPLDDKVECIAVSPDGKLFAAGENGKIRVWKLKAPEK